AGDAAGAAGRTRRNDTTSAAASAVPGRCQDRLLPARGRVPELGGGEGRARARPSARPEEAERERRKGQATAGEPAEAPDQRQRDERGGTVAAREGNRAAAEGRRALPAGRSGGDQRVAAGSAERLREEAVADHRCARRGEGTPPRIQRGTVRH